MENFASGGKCQLAASVSSSSGDAVKAHEWHCSTRVHLGGCRETFLVLCTSQAASMPCCGKTSIHTQQLPTIKLKRFGQANAASAGTAITLTLAPSRLRVHTAHSAAALSLAMHAFIVTPSPHRAHSPVG